ncbi:multisubstrate pseudouridine synthase 7 [Saxophila tyrrhenica]|uniref:Multisubstrate pseudouridine synthase 7 n=1 Tax=Saxophila tyrrhenica TaxID=1690608 RepID=A0AAV9NY26_9PEZI|nr:multisubstrate pseudouridine synthase 7 [Saxophila tyrrhenica]
MTTSALRDQEKAVGITAFVSPDAPGFGCTIKHRYTDFLVNEVLPDGTVLHLTSDAVKRVKKQAQEEVPQDGGMQEVKSEVKSEVTDGMNGVTAEGSTKRKQPEGDDAVADPPSSPSKRQRVDGGKNTAPQSNGDAEAAQKPEADPNADRKAQIISNVTDQDKSRLHDIFGEKTTDRILHLYASIIMHPDRKPRDQPVIHSEVITEKAKRTEAHVAVRQVFASKISTETIQDSPGVIVVRAMPTKGPTGARAPAGQWGNGAISKGKLGWEELGGEYLHFTLYKENKDTMEVLWFLASQLKIPVKNFQFAGTKDRRGVTVQRVALYRVHADKIKGLNRFSRGWWLGGFEYQKHGLDLGELGGNEFLLTLRDIQVEGVGILTPDQKVERVKEIVQQATKSFREHGYLNYYGLQRFGTYTTGTHATGLKMLKGDLEGAINLILTYDDKLLPENVDTSAEGRTPHDDINRADAIRIYRERGGITEAVRKMPRRFQAESAIIQHLGKRDRRLNEQPQKNDWQGALMQIQRNLRLMYVHAYQSFVWNTVVGKRWELYDGKVVEGDLVIVGAKDDSKPVKEEVDDQGEPVFHPAADDSAPTAEDPFTRARHLSKEEAESGKYDIFDIVLPLPGFDVLYPANEVGKFYGEFMASEEGGGLDPHNMRRSWKDISLSGGYRKVLARAGEGLDFEIKTYVTDAEQMVETDLEKLKKQKHANRGPAAGGSNGVKAEDQTDEVKAEEPANDVKSDEPTDDVKEGEQTNGNAATDAAIDAVERKIAVVLKMQLGSSQYATMALRELTKGGALNYKPDYSSR